MSKVKTYTLGIQTASKSYTVRVKQFTQEEFEKYYDTIASKGEKIIGIKTS